MPLLCFEHQCAFSLSFMQCCTFTFSVHTHTHTLRHGQEKQGNNPSTFQMVNDPLPLPMTKELLRVKFRVAFIIIFVCVFSIISQVQDVTF